GLGHPRHHQHPTFEVLGDGWDEAVVVELERAEIHVAFLVLQLRRLQVQAGAAVETFGRPRVDVALAKDQVVLALHLDLVTVLGAEQHLVGRLDVAHVRPDRHHFGPHQSLRDLRSGGDQDAGAGPALALRLRDLHEHAVGQHGDGLLRIVRSGGGRHGPTVPSPPMPIEPVSLHTSDGLALEAELSVPDDAWAAAVLAHPHPQFGGNMRSIVPGALIEALPRAGVAALRFNFRGVEGSEGAYDEGRGEQLDVIAAIDALSEIAEGLPLVLAGWSFGADTSLAVGDERVDGWAAIAPPLRVVKLDDMVAPK